MVLIILIILAIFFPLLWIIVIPLILVHVGAFLLNKWADRANALEERLRLEYWFYNEFIPEVESQITSLDMNSPDAMKYPANWLFNMAQLYEINFTSPKLKGGFFTLKGGSAYDFCGCYYVADDNAWYEVSMLYEDEDEVNGEYAKMTVSYVGHNMDFRTYTPPKSGTL